MMMMMMTMMMMMMMMMLARVPWMFLMLGCVYLLCGLVATLLISEPDHSSETQTFNSDSIEEVRSSLKPTQVLRTPVFYQVGMNKYNKN